MMFSHLYTINYSTHWTLSNPIHNEKQDNLTWVQFPSAACLVALLHSRYCNWQSLIRGLRLLADIRDAFFKAETLRIWRQFAQRLGCLGRNIYKKTRWITRGHFHEITVRLATRCAWNVRKTISASEQKIKQIIVRFFYFWKSHIVRCNNPILSSIYLCTMRWKQTSMKCVKSF